MIMTCGIICMCGDGDMTTKVTRQSTTLLADSVNGYSKGGSR